MFSLNPTKGRKSSCARAGLASVVAVAAILSLTPTLQAGHSSTPHPFKNASIKWAPTGDGRAETPSVLVGHDGDNYTHLVGEISTRFKLKAKVKSGHRIYGWTVTTGEPETTDQLPVDLQGARNGVYDKSIDTHATFSMDANTAVSSGTPGITPNRAQEIVEMCNSAFDVPPESDRGVGQINLTVHGAFSAGDWKGTQFVSWTGWYPAGARSRPAIAHTTFPVNVVCLDRADFRLGDLTPKPVNVDIRVKQKGDTCPKDTEVSAYIDYDRPTTARFRIFHNGVEPKSSPIKIKARKVSLAGKTWYRVERMQRYKLDPGKHSFQIKVLGNRNKYIAKSPKKTVAIDCPPFKVSSIWLSYEVENKQTCKKKVTEKWAAYATRPGDFPFRITTQGGLVVSQGIAYASREGDKYVARRTRHLTMGAFDQMMRVEVVNDLAINDQKPLKVECLEVMSGTLELRKFAASRCEGEAAFSIRTNMPGDVPYKLDCTGNRSWSGTVKAHNTGPGTYIGVATKRFAVSSNEQVNCALKTRKPFPVKILALRGNKYACHRSTVDPGSDDLAPNPGQQPDPPPVGRKLTGDFSFIDNGGTRCERQGSALINFTLKEPTNVHYSLDCTNGHFSGVAQAVSDGKGGYVAPALVRFDIAKTTHAKCALKSVAPGKPKVHKLKGHLFRCVIPEVEPGANDLVNDPRPPSAPAGSGPGRIVDPVRIACLGGVVRNRSCYCPRTHKKTQTGPNAWRCDRKVVVDPPRTPPSSGPGRTVDPHRIACYGGVVRNRSCYCPRTHKRMPIGRNAYRCVKNMVVVPPRQGGASAVTGGKRKIAIPPTRKTAAPPKRKRGATAGSRSINRSIRLR